MFRGDVSLARSSFAVAGISWLLKDACACDPGVSGTVDLLGVDGRLFAVLAVLLTNVFEAGCSSAGLDPAFCFDCFAASKIANTSDSSATLC